MSDNLRPNIYIIRTKQQQIAKDLRELAATWGETFVVFAHDVKGSLTAV